MLGTRIKNICAVALATAALSCSPFTVKVDGGLVQGVKSEDGNSIVFKGVPFAAPPTGELRWQEPSAVVPWEGVRICDSFSNAAIQNGNQEGTFYWHEYYVQGDAPFSEDCLYLNVWAPKKPGKYPVAVWFHGGAFQSGWSFETEFDGQEWANRGVILVTVNYRLGPFGYIRHPLLDANCPQGAGNYGTLDQIESLRWVSRNIKGFGGDPDNVTIFGQSAGALSVMNLCASPLAKGLFHKAIIQSGGACSPYSMFYDIKPEALARQTGLVEMNLAGLNSLEEMYSASPELILSTVDLARKELNSPFINWPSINQSVLPQTFASALESGMIADVPFIIGGTKDDMMGLGEGMETFAKIRAQKSDKPVFIYKFNRELPGDIAAGAFHSAELWYVFGTLSRSSRPFTQQDYALSAEIIDYWTSFAKTGNPGNDWKAWSEENDNINIFDVNE